MQFSRRSRTIALSLPGASSKSRNMRQWFPEGLFPHICLLCDQVCSDGATSDLCPPCRSSLPWNKERCPRCAIPTVGALKQQLCGACRRAPPSFRRCVAPLLYQDHPRLWVRRLKFHHGLVEARLLGTLLADAVLDEYPHQALPDVLIPVPLSLRRLASRGHNQALSLATVVGGRVQRRVIRRQVRRTRHGATQRGSSRKARHNNLIGAFASHPWQGERVAVIDDVMTTGATLEALASTLLAAGASEVHAWCATRTPGEPAANAQPSRPC